MSHPAARRLRRALTGLALVALGGAVLPGGAGAQVRPDSARRAPRDTVSVPIPPRPDSLFTDSVAAADSLRRADSLRVAHDTLRAPLAVAPVPPPLTAGAAYAWGRDEIFASGALTLLDLLERVPGVTGFRTGWLLPPEQASYDGAFDRIRIFYDGVELAPLSARDGGVRDLSTIELWPLQQVVAERGAGELRVYLRSWTVERTVPETRTDVATGQLRTNLFRGFYGRRFRHGEAVQLGFQQYSAGDPVRGGDGDQLSLMGRVGWARGDWRVDAYGITRHRTMASLERRSGFVPLPAFEEAERFGYLRAGFREPSAPGVWAQLLASASASSEQTDFTAPTELLPADSADTTRSRPQYVAMTGLNAGALHLTGVGRYSALQGERYFSPLLRGEVTSRFATFAARAERRAEDSTQRLEVAGEFRPVQRLRAVAAVGRVSGTGDDEREPVTTVRGEVGLLLGRMWITGGALRGGARASGAPSRLDPGYVSLVTDPGTMLYGAARGRFWKDVGVDLQVSRWTGSAAEAFYRPQQQAHAELYLASNWLSRFPSGEFGIRAAAAVDYRSQIGFPVGETGLQSTDGATAVSAQLEIRIQQAVAFVESRNSMGSVYETVPGYLMPRAVVIYGVRWRFWN